MFTDQDLSDAVYSLRHRDLSPEARQTVEEAARLLADGREGEARALLEKAEALAALPAAANGAAKTPAAPAAGVAPLAAKLAEGFTAVLTRVLEDLHQYAGEQVQSAVDSLADHIAHLDTTIRDTTGEAARLGQRVDEQQAGLLAVQQAQAEVWTAIRRLQQSGQEHHESISRVAAAAEELTQHMSSQVDVVASRFSTLEERVETLDRLVHEMPAQLSGILTRLDSHTETLRGLEQRHTQRVSTLNQVLDSLARLKEPEPPERAVAAFA